jgi:hypothetical protein
MSTGNLHLILRCKEIKDLVWYIDGSYATHEDMRGQDGAILMTGDCAVLFRSNKQKVSTQSLTESELLAVDDALPTIQWTRNFMSEQGYNLETHLKEDNRSTMLMMKNGKLSAGKQAKHFNIQYYYVKILSAGLLCPIVPPLGPGTPAWWLSKQEWVVGQPSLFSFFCLTLLTSNQLHQPSCCRGRPYSCSGSCWECIQKRCLC